MSNTFYFASKLKYSNLNLFSFTDITFRQLSFKPWGYSPG